MSQRALAAVESGRAAPSTTTLSRLLAAGGLELGAVPAVPAATEELERYLHLSTTRRLHRSLGGRHSLRGPQPQAWRELVELSGSGRLTLLGASGVGVWLPVVDVVRPLTVGVLAPDGPLPPVRELDVVAVTGTVPGAVPVALPRRGVVDVVPPLMLAEDPQCGAWAGELRRAAALLFEGRPRTSAGRAEPAHRHPRERDEADRLLALKAFDMTTVPRAIDSRAWRLGGAASLAQWVETGRPH